MNIVLLKKGKDVVVEKVLFLMQYQAKTLIK